ncbi:hypothetical protein [Leptospira perdikensis]|uniref:Uncharacterized protein n=1 Tax=Leptospira perdikensis TaxID=2484948 RepID=A0A4R9JAP3_9LEPT|nr:hypothetical protein [Leptospira perdikensis]TGL35940.1 hypothetical protein EHQ49_16725 [Leptospira perdikensis]
MKKKFIFCLIIFANFTIILGENPENENDQYPVSEQIEINQNDADKDLIINILGDIVKFNPNPKDTEVQKKLRSKNQLTYLKEINSKWIGKKISFESVNLNDVKAETELSPEGIKQSKKLIQQIKNDPSSQLLYGDGNIEKNPLIAFAIAFQLAFCNTCWQETGKYNAIYYLGKSEQYYDSKIISKNIEDSTSEIEQNNEIQVEIQKVFPDEKSVINLEKNKVTTLIGTIKSINYESGQFMSPKLKVYLK